MEINSNRDITKYRKAFFPFFDMPAFPYEFQLHFVTGCAKVKGNSF